MHCEIPDHNDEWMRRMRRGEFESAWRLSDAVLRSGYPARCHHLPRHLQSVWDGRPLDGRRVLIRCYHGLGDTIHFIRYAPLVKSRASEVILLAQSELIPLLRTVDGIDRIFPLEAGDGGLDYDADAEVMELPHVFRTTLETIPANVPYFHVGGGLMDPPNNGTPGHGNAQDVMLSVGEASSSRTAVVQRDPWRTAQDDRTRRQLMSRKRRDSIRVYLPDDKLHVGIVWAAGDWDPRRSIPPELLAPLGEIPGIELHIFQRGAALSDSPPWRALMPQWHDILEEARLMRALDLMISVDSLPAHLAGALAVPVWTLLHREADWRWLKKRNDSPWYPTMRLFRQECGKGWVSVIANVASELASLSAALRAGDAIRPQRT
jgi:hypothetical protein